MNLCPHCGSSDVELGYGLAGGNGIGVYMFCNACERVFDKTPDPEMLEVSEALRTDEEAAP